MSKTTIALLAAFGLLVTGHGALLASLLVLTLIAMFIYAATIGGNQLRNK